MQSRWGEVQAARRGLSAMLTDLDTRLETNVFWLALRRLEEDPRQGHPTKAGDLSLQRAQLVARLDADVPDWRLRAGIAAAIAALDQALAQAAASHALRHASASEGMKPNSRSSRRSKSAKPLVKAVPGADPERQAQERVSLVERIRQVHSAHTADQTRSSDFTRHEDRNPDFEVEVADQAAVASVASPGLTHDGLEKLAVSELEVDQLLPAGQSAPTAIAAERSGAPGEWMGPIEEAEVEIVILETSATARDVDDRLPATSTERIDRGWQNGEKSSISPLPNLEEATVEIVILETNAGTPSDGGIPRVRRMKP